MHARFGSTYTLQIPSLIGSRTGSYIVKVRVVLQMRRFLHRSTTLPQLADYLLRERNFKYVLPRHIQSDCLEGWYGWIRQLTGTDYYASSRQILEAEKIIKIVSLVKFSNLSMSEIKEVFSENNIAFRKQIEMDATAFLEVIDFSPQLTSISSEDKGTIHKVRTHKFPCF